MLAWLSRLHWALASALLAVASAASLMLGTEAVERIHQALDGGAGLLGAVPMLLSGLCAWLWARVRGPRPLLSLLISLETFLLAMMALAMAMTQSISFGASDVWWKAVAGFLALPLTLPLSAFPAAAIYLGVHGAAWGLAVWQDVRQKAPVPA